MSDGFDDAYATHADYFGAGPTEILAEFGARLDPERPVLDIGSGQGRNAVYLAEMGLKVDAVDPSDVAAETVRRVASQRALPIEAFCCGFDEHVGAPGYGGILAFGLIPLLPRPKIAALVDRIDGWADSGTLCFVTAFTVDDPSYAGHAESWKRIGRESFADDKGQVRTYLGRGELPYLLRGWEVIRFREYVGDEHHHGDGPAHRHAHAEGVFRR